MVSPNCCFGTPQMFHQHKKNQYIKINCSGCFTDKHNYTNNNLDLVNSDAVYFYLFICYANKITYFLLC